MKKILFNICLFILISATSMAQQSPEDPFKGFSITDGFNAIELAHHISISNDFDKGKNYILSTSSLAFKKDYENKNFLSADRTEGFKERFWMSQHPKNDYALNVCITVSKWTDEDITKTLSKLGYEELSSKESTPFGIYTKQCTYKNSATATEAFLEITKKNNRVKKEIKFTNTSKATLEKDSNKEASTSKVAQKEKEETNKNPQLISNTSNIKADKRLPKVNEQKFKVKNVEFSMRFVPHGTFTMGKGDNTMKVELSNDYWVSETEVTTGLYDAVMETNIGGTGQRAVTCTWLQAMEFIRRLNILTGYNFRMITEAEWEYAARYGNGNKKYSGGDKPEDVLNTRDVKDSQQGALNKPNYLGIYGMSNKTSEWCYDIFQAKYPTFTRPQRNYLGPKAEDMKGKEQNHVVRSGGAMYYQQNADVDLYDRTSEYEGLMPLGIRLALYDNDIKNKVPQAIEKHKVNLPAGMPVRWHGGRPRTFEQSYVFIHNERHQIIEHKKLEGKIGYGYVYVARTKERGVYLIEKIVMTGKNSFTLTLVSAENGAKRTASFTYTFRTKTWMELKCTSTNMEGLTKASFIQEN